MRLTACALVLVPLLAGCPKQSTLSVEDELAFRQLREEFHVANMTGDEDLIRSLFAEDAVLTTDTGETYVGADAITAFLSSNPNFGNTLVLTTESSWTADTRGDIAEYGFESIAVDLAGMDRADVMLADGGAQNPDVEIVAHTNSTGTAARAADGSWVFQELHAAPGPLPPTPLLDGASLNEDDASAEVGFRRMRERFHLATITGDRELLRSVWADDAVFRGGPNEVFGGDAIVDFMASSPNFGQVLVVTPEISAKLTANGDTAEYAFECITTAVSGQDPRSVDLCMPGGTQNPSVEIIRHTNTSGTLRRLPDGRWVFQEFNGALGPIVP